MRRLLALGLALLGLLTCAKERRPVALEDSAGYASATGGLAIDSIPILAVSSDEIGHIVGAARLGHEVVIADGYRRSLVFFDLEGSQRRTVGRTGGGPGEFESITWMGQCGGESAFTWDPGQLRLSAFDRRGNYSRGVRLPGTPAIITCSRTGAFAILMSPDGSMASSGMTSRLTSRLVVTNSHGDSAWGRPDVYVGQYRPLAAITRIALSKDHLFVGSGDSAFVDVYDTVGTMIKTTGLPSDSM